MNMQKFVFVVLIKQVCVCNKEVKNGRIPRLARDLTSRLRNSTEMIKLITEKNAPYPYCVCLGGV